MGGSRCKLRLAGHGRCVRQLGLGDGLMGEGVDLVRWRQSSACTRGCMGADPCMGKELHELAGKEAAGDAWACRTDQEKGVGLGRRWRVQAWC